MNDPLQRFMDSHSKDVDDLEPSSDIFLRVKEELKESNPRKERRNVKLAFAKRWMAAASVLLLLFAGYLVLNEGNERTEVVQKVKAAKANKNNTEQSIDKKNIYPDMGKRTDEAVVVKGYPKKDLTTPTKKVIDMEGVYRDLQDSTSSSTRLSAVLKIRRTANLNYDMVDRLATTLANDDNSNVRLAVLSVLGQYTDDGYVCKVLVESLNTQKDPNAQLGLIELLSRTESMVLDNSLYALLNDPNTITAVRDHANLVLLSQNKL